MLMQIRKKKGNLVEIFEKKDLEKLDEFKIGNEGIIGNIAFPSPSTRIKLDNYGKKIEAIFQSVVREKRKNDLLVVKDTCFGLNPTNEIGILYWGLKENKYISYVNDGNFSVWPIRKRVLYSNKNKYDEAKIHVEKYFRERHEDFNIKDFIFYDPGLHEIYKKMLIKNRSWEK